MALKPDTDLAELRKRIRHSASHVMADVVTTWTIDTQIGTWTADGFVTDISFDFPTEELMTGSFTLKVSTSITTANA